MTTRDVKRKLAAILSADVKGYSRLMSEDEVGTIHTLGAYKEVMARFIQHHHGRVVDAPGDNVLAEFPSVVDAVQCGLKIQNELKTRNAEFSENRRMEFRIGINLGDVVEEEGKIFGDGVNIAARLESLSEAGGICISGKAYDEVKNKLLLGYKYLGEQTVKNVPERIRAYQILLEPQAAGKVIGEKKAIPGRWKITAIGLVVILIVVAAAVIWRSYLRTSWTPVEPASKEKMAFPLPDVPSIAVLPFVNMSDDPKQEFFGDGLTEDLITALSKVPNLFVIARNSTFTYKGKPVKVQQVAEELGVRYVLEGSVRRDAGRVRITAQLVDAIKGIHLWAERYDRDLKDIFAIQDDVTKQIIAALHVKLTIGEGALVTARETNSLEAYLKYLQARWHHFRFTKEDILISRRLTEEAISIDPEYGQAYSLLATTHMMDVWLRTTESPKQSLGKAIELARRAIALGAAGSHGLLGWLYAMARQHDKAIAECQQAVDLDPNSASAHAWYGMVLNSTGRFEEAVHEFEQAVRLDPFSPSWVLRSFGSAYSGTGRYEEAIATFKKAVQKAPNDLLSHLFLAHAYSQAGRMEEAQTEAAEVLRIDPKFSLEYFAKQLTLKNQDDRDRLIEALRKAGLK